MPKDKGTSSSSFAFLWKSQKTIFVFIQRNHLLYSSLLLTLFSYLSLYTFPGDRCTTGTSVTKYTQLTHRSVFTAWAPGSYICLTLRALHV